MPGWTCLGPKNDLDIHGERIEQAQEAIPGESSVAAMEQAGNIGLTQAEAFGRLDLV